MQEQWKLLRDAIKDSANEHIGRTKGCTAKKQWVTQAMLIKMDERRKWKNVNTDDGKKMYRRLINRLRRETDEAREMWWKQTCTEIEELDKQGKSDILYQKVKDLSEGKQGSRKQQGIINKEGEMTTEKIEILNRWKEYTEDLYGKDSRPKVIFTEEKEDVEEDNVGPKIL